MLKLSIREHARKKDFMDSFGDSGLKICIYSYINKFMKICVNKSSGSFFDLGPRTLIFYTQKPWANCNQISCRATWG